MLICKHLPPDYGSVLHFSPRQAAFPMSPDVQARRRYRFGVFQLDTLTGELYKHGIRIKLQDQPCQVLTILLERVGEVVTREELRQRLWDHDTFVDFDHSLNISINKLRDALGDAAANPRFIETLPRKGYRFLAAVNVEEVSDNRVAAPASIISPPTPEMPSPSSTGNSSEQIPSRKWSPLWLGIAILTLAVVAIGSWLWWKQAAASKGATSGRVMLAVLPFEDLTGNKGNDFFVAGLHDELIAQLGRLYPSRLGVIARTSAVQYAGAHKSIDQIGRELHVDYVLDGTIRSVNGKFRITAELIQVSDQTHLWVETYEPGMGDILMLQEDVARRVSQVLSMEFLPDTIQKMEQNTTENAEAHEAYLRGRFLWSQETDQSLNEAVKEFQKAVSLDPKYALAYVGLADTYNVLGGMDLFRLNKLGPKAKRRQQKRLILRQILPMLMGPWLLPPFITIGTGVKPKSCFVKRFP